MALNVYYLMYQKCPFSAHSKLVHTLDLIRRLCGIVGYTHDIVLYFIQ